jgi:pyrrolidone-carboxylate peptidase
MENIILTGFKPFGPYKYNPVQDVAMDFNKKIINNIKVH